MGIESVVRQFRIDQVQGGWLTIPARELSQALSSAIRRAQFFLGLKAGKSERLLWPPLCVPPVTKADTGPTTVLLDEQDPCGLQRLTYRKFIGGGECGRRVREFCPPNCIDAQSCPSGEIFRTPPQKGTASSNLRPRQPRWLVILTHMIGLAKWRLWCGEAGEHVLCFRKADRTGYFDCPLPE